MLLLLLLLPLLLLLSVVEAVTVGGYSSHFSRRFPSLM
jgi:hypothetical protein